MARRTADLKHLTKRTTDMTTETTTATTLSLSGLETVYDALAAAVDRAGPDRAELFLVKLALLNAHALGDATRFQQLVTEALQDLS